MPSNIIILGNLQKLLGFPNSHYKLNSWNCLVADPGFPFGGALTPSVAGNFQCEHFSAEMYAKKRRRWHPTESANETHHLVTTHPVISLESIVQ